MKLDSLQGRKTLNHAAAATPHQSKRALVGTRSAQDTVHTVLRPPAVVTTGARRTLAYAHNLPPYLCGPRRPKQPRTPARHSYPFSPHLFRGNAPGPGNMGPIACT